MLLALGLGWISGVTNISKSGKNRGVFGFLTSECYLFYPNPLKQTTDGALLAHSGYTVKFGWIELLSTLIQNETLFVVYVRFFSIFKFVCKLWV